MIELILRKSIAALLFICTAALLLPGIQVSAVEITNAEQPEEPYNIEENCDISLYPGQTYTLTGMPADAQYFSSDRLVADVSASGVVTAVCAGRAFVTVCSGGTVIDRLSVYVRRSVAYINLTGTSETVLCGKTCQITAKAMPADAADTNLIYSSSDTSIATVSQSGLVTAVGDGTAVITIQAADGCGASAQFTVECVATRVYLSSYYVPMKPGAKFNIRSSVSSLYSGIYVTYQSSDTSVATVTPGGKITAVGNGKAEIYAKSSDGRSTRTLVVDCDSSITGYGIDISRHNGEISPDSWRKIRDEGVDFVIIRIGYGREAEQEDVLFQKNYDNARAAGLKVGIYHYSYAKTVDQARREAETTLGWLNGRELDFPIYFDIEDDSQNILGSLFFSSVAEAYCNAMEKAGYEVGIYSSAYLLKTRMYDSVLKNREVWMAHYETDDPHSLYAGRYNMWQFTDRGRINGISGDVDLNVYVEPAPESNTEPNTEPNT